VDDTKIILKDTEWGDLENADLVQERDQWEKTGSFSRRTDRRVVSYLVHSKFS
jgi:hypothetical protein